jgi:ATP-binding cassette, subfamily F, member 3
VPVKADKVPARAARSAPPPPAPAPAPAPPAHQAPARPRVIKRSASTKPANGEAAARPHPVEAADPIARRRSFEADKAVARSLERKKKRVHELEGEIKAHEGELDKRREELKRDPGGDWAKLASLAKEEQALARQLDAVIAEWMALTEELGASQAGRDA